MSIVTQLNGVNPWQVETLVHLLQARANTHPDKLAFVFLPDGEGQSVELTYGELHRAAQAVAQTLSVQGACGDRALMLFPSGLDFIVAFFGCLYAGVIGVPAYPPRRNQNLGRLQSIITDCEPAWVLTTRKVMRIAEPLFEETPGLQALNWLAVDDVEERAGQGWVMPDINRDHLAFLQYTSGSTGNPKGVMVSHGNLLYNAGMIQNSGFRFTEQERVVSWLPLFHDMGLIGMTLQPLYVGVTATFMSPASFLQRPLRWLKTVTDIGGTVICAPNFAYELCVKQITPEQRSQLDLSTITHALSGSEGVRADTIEAFIDAFGPNGFQRGAFIPTYGLAEATLFVTCADEGRRPLYQHIAADALAKDRAEPIADARVGSLTLVSNGRTSLDAQLAIVDPITHQRLPDQQVGEVWAAGQHIAQGYWRNPAATRETFQAYLGKGDGPWLRTGDLGFVLDGDLYITGRMKDVIIIRGRNHYPADIEFSVQQSHIALKADAGAAFSVDIDGIERLIVVQEVERTQRKQLNIDAVAAAARQAVAQNHELQLHTLVLIKPGRILKTSSGKIQRRGNRQAFLQGDFAGETIAEWTLPSANAECQEVWRQALALDRDQCLALPVAEQSAALTQYLKALLVTQLQLDPEQVDADQPLTALGIDSLQLTQLFARVQTHFNVRIDLAALFDAGSLIAVTDLLQQAMSDHSEPALPDLHAAELTGELPLAFVQKRLWFFDRLHPGLAVYNLPFAVRLQGALDGQALQVAVRALLRRHAILRSRYLESAGKLYLTIDSPDGWDMPVGDLRSLEGRALEQRIDELLQEWASRPFALDKGQLLRAGLYRLPDVADEPKAASAQQWLFVLTVHHIVTDGWSLGLLVRELAQLYYSAYQAQTLDETAVLQSATGLPDLTVQYPDYARWQQRLADSDSWHESLAFWRDQLQDVSVLDLPTDHSRPAEFSYRGAHTTFSIPHDKVQALKQLSQREGVTLYNTLLATFKVLLHLYSHQDDICVGTPVANRAHPALEPLIGFFVNTLAIRADLSGNPSFLALLHQLRQRLHQAFAHQQVPFDQVVDVLGVTRDLSYNPLFQVMFVLQSAGLDNDFHLHGVEVTRLSTHAGTAKFDLTLELTEQKGALRADLEYAADLFDASTMVRFGNHYLTLIDSILANAETPVGQLNLLTQKERELLFGDYNATEQRIPRDSILHSLVEAAVARQGQREALVDEQQRLTFSQLNQRANQLSRHLTSLGVVPGSLVGVCLNRHADMVVALLAVLKAGGAYVPLDPAYPPERIAFMMEDTQAPVLISESTLVPSLPKAEQGPQVLPLDELGSVLRDYPDDNPGVAVMPSQLAYIIYTSGSTGKPKGVMISHANACAMVHWSHSVYSPEDLSGTLLSTSLCFDLSVWEIFVTLSAGGKLIVAENALALPGLAARDEVRLINTVPSAIAALQRQNAIPASVKVINLAGEALPSSLVDLLYSTTAVQRVYDLYGPSEDTTYSTYALRQPGKPATIGRPITNTRAYILNPHGAPVAPGIVGELYLAGLGITQGYLNREELTAEKYLPNPFDSDPDYRTLYRTGDLVRYQSGGLIEYLGRIDHQVKVRGFRIELGEIETAINSATGVKSSLVMTRDDKAGHTVLVAYIVLEAGAEADAVISAIRVAIKGSLPDYMMPTAFVTLDAFPLTPNGKIDRKALPEPRADLLLQDQYVAPSTPTEHALAGLWQDLLGGERIGTHTDFFALGGHSLLAAQLVARIQDQFGVQLPIKALFQAPTIAALSDLLDGYDRDVSLAPPPVRPVNRESDLPLSFAQQRLWFLNQLEAGDAEFNISTSYNMAAALRLTGRLQVKALRKAFQALVERHEVLRTSFEVDNGVARQVIRSPSDWFLDVRDISDLEYEPREAEIRRLAIDEATRSFDLLLGPLSRARRIRLLRTRLLRTAAEEHVLLLTMHHIISDGWSLGILIDEISELYGAFVEGRDAHLTELTVQYADYAQWQRDWMAGPVFDHQLGYWQRQLAGVPVLELPTDKPRPPLQTFHGAHETVRIAAPLVRRLNELGNSQGATLFMTLLAAFYALLYRYSGQTDLCIGTPVANRARPEFEPLIGCFVNSLALRADLNNDPRFVDLLLQVEDLTLDAYAHQDLPFERLVEALGVSRDKSHSPLFQVMFTLQNASADHELRLPGLALDMLPSVVQTAKFDLTLNLAERADGLIGELEYNTDLFERDTIHRMVGHFECLLEAIVDHPQNRLSELPLLTEQEHRLIVSAWNHAPGNYAWQDTIQGRFEAQVATNGNAPALTFDGEHLSYAELNWRANQLAHYLRGKGVSADDLIGISLERSFDMVIAILGVLKAGGAYVPIDPANPEERMAFILDDAAVKLLVTDSSVHARLPAGHYQPVLLDELGSVLADQADDNPEPISGPDHRAYVIYTSGTTGKPKGVLIPHSNVIRLMTATEQWYGFDSDDVWTLFHSFAFDFTVWELWGALFYGGRLVIVPQAVAKATEDFYALTREQGVTVLNQTPSAFTQYIRVDDQQLAAHKTLPPLALRFVIFGGEALDFAALTTWVERHGLEQPQLINMYGITETTVHVTYHRITAVDLVQRASLIGRPIPDLDVYILDRHLNPVPIGVPGELYVGGQGVAHGYLKRADLTDERFIANPFGTSLNRTNHLYQRLYKTGDLGRYRSDGTIEYLGRIDHQVKVRGYRIELGEIETCISQQDGVQEAVVQAVADDQGDKQLVAWVVSQGDPLDAAELKKMLRRQLPEYMVPSTYVMLDALPLTPNGKVDTKALPSPDGAIASTAEFVAPRNDTEQRLVEIWETVLQHRPIGVRDNFFDIGGHSLLATQVVSRIREAFDHELPLSVLFNEPTIAAIADQLVLAGRDDAGRSADVDTQRADGAAWQPIPAAPRSSNRMPMSYAQQRLWFLDQLQSGTANYNISAALRLNGNLDVEALRLSFEEIVNRHEALRTTFVNEHGQGYQVINPPQRWELPTISLEPLSAEEQEEVLRTRFQGDAHFSFDLINGPLLRSRLIRLAYDHHILIVTMHHIIADGWSMGVLIQEMAHLYTAFCQDRSPRLPALNIQYADYARWQKQYLADQRGEQQLAWWKQQLQNVPVLELPADYPRPPIPSFEGRSESFQLTPTQTLAIRELAKQQGVTRFMVLLAVLQVLLWRYSQQRDFCIGTPIANRIRPEIEGLIGCFVNTLALRAHIEPEHSFVALLSRVQQHLTEAYDRQDVPFERLVDELGLVRDMSHTPLFQVMFVLQNPLSLSDVNLPGIELSQLPEQSTTAKFDLTINLRDDEDGLCGVWEYRTDLFDAATIQRMMAHFGRLLDAITAAPQAPLHSFAMLSLTEREQILSAWNQTHTPYERDANMVDLFRQQVTKAPQAIAISTSDQSLSYEQLDRWSDQLAARLLATRPLTPGEPVGLCAERSPAMVAGVLAILKAGGAYLPLDPAYPAERLQFMMDTARLRVAMVSRHLLADLPLADRLVVDLTSVPDDAADTTLQPLPTVAPDSTAYVMFTSGSTGKPKGIEVTHRNVLRLVRHADFMRLDESVVFLHYATLSFDASTLELWGPLLNGGRIALCPPGQLSAEDISREIRIQKVNTALFTAALLHVFAEYHIDALSGLSQLLGGGDVLSPDLMRKILRHYPELQLINAYGPTENTVITTAYQMNSPDQVRHTVPIGRPIANTQVYVLDEWLHPVPIGVAGELCTAGDGVAKGYLYRDDLTSKLFVNNSFSQSADDKVLYRTGDLVRYLPDGLIEYLGRVDQQVKIRGFRIELGEVEAALARLPSVREVVVIAREDTPGQKRLVAYLVPADEHLGASQDLRLELRDVLPVYMIPSAFVVLNALPLTPNGKLDRRALPRPADLSDNQASDIVAATNDREARLVEIWTQLLGTEQVGIHDNFFELGGDSILSIQMISRAKRVGLHLTAKQIFEHQTIAELAAVATDSGLVIQAEQGDVQGDIALTPIQHWFFEQQLADPSHFNQSLLVTLDSRITQPLLETAWLALIRHHDMLRACFTENSTGGWRQWIPPYDDSADWASHLFAHQDLSTTEEDAQSALLTEVCSELQASLRLSQGHLVKVAYLHRGSTQPARLLIVIHHAVIDIVSWRILIEDMHTAFHQLLQGLPVNLGSKTTSFQQWSGALQHYAQLPDIQVERDWWLQQSKLPVVPLPVDHGGSNRIGDLHVYENTLERSQTHSLLTETAACYRTDINDLLLTALARTLARWTGHDVVRIDLEGHGREPFDESLDVTRTLGWFTAITPVWLQLPDLADPGLQIKSIKEQIRQIPGKGFGYGVLRYLSDMPEGQNPLAALPAAQVSFNYLGQLDQGIAEDALVQPASESPGPEIGADNTRAYTLEIGGRVQDGQLRLAWRYAATQFESTTIARWAEQYLAELGVLINHCRDARHGGYTPSDFPLAGLDQQHLDQVLPWQRGIEAIYPLSPAQEGMLFHTLYEPESWVYFNQVSVDLGPDVSEVTLLEAWRQVIVRHPILRSAFIWEHVPRPLQVVHEQMDLEVIRYDWRGFSDAEAEQRRERYLIDDRHLGFNFQRPGVMRLTWLRLPGQRQQLIWSFHHLLLDGWSMPVVFQELFVYYDSLTRGQPANLPRAGRYQDFIAWLMSRDQASAQAFWTDYLAGFRAPTPIRLKNAPALIAQRAKTAQHSPRYQESEVILDSVVLDRLQRLAKQHHLTLNHIIQGAWGVLLSRYAGESDVVFGATVAGRPAELAGVESMVGMFINTLPLRLQVAENQPFIDWLTAAQTQQRDALNYSYSSLVDIQRCSEVPAKFPLFESILVFENYPINESLQATPDSLQVDHIEAYEQTNFPLTFVVVPGQQLMLRFSYDSFSFERVIIDNMLGHMLTLLAAIADAPGTTIAALPWLTEREQHYWTRDINAVDNPLPQPPTLVALFDRQVASAGAHPAYEDEQEQHSYRQLQHASQQVAAWLLEQGVQPGDCVAVCLDRSTALLTAMLAILRCQATYVPLDPAYPDDRLSHMVADTGATLLISQETAAQRLATIDLAGAPIALWPEVWSAAQQLPAVQGETVSTNPVACVMYTSGSTGKPKGVPIPQAGIVRLVVNTNYIALTRQHRVAHVANVSFDAATFEIWGALLNGATLVGIDQPTLVNPPRFAQVLRERRISVALLTTAVFNLMARFQPAMFAGMDYLLFGGESADPHQVRAVLEQSGAPRHLINAYGPTENATCSACYQVTQVLAGATSVPVGTCISNSTLYVFDTHRQPVPLGVPGEIWVGGPGLTPGYLNRPELNDSQFMADPYRPGERLYRTGDIGRYLPEGALEILGRQDDQVKIRGFRIELGEIETQLAALPAIAAACVVVQTRGDQRLLLAYCQPRRPNDVLDFAALRSQLRQRLPDYMMPTGMVVVDKLPITANGKVDKKALPAPAESAWQVTAYVAPRTELETSLAQIWQEVLQVSKVGIYDDFFDLGGHSLLVTQTASRINERLQVNLPLRTLFEVPVISALAELIQAVKGELPDDGDESADEEFEGGTL